MRFLLLLACCCLPAVSIAKLNVFACEPEWADLTQQLGGDLVNVFQATTARQDAHHIQARPSLIARMRKADLLVCSGADLEVGWLPLLIRSASNKKVLTGGSGYFEAAEQVERLEMSEFVDRSGGDIHAKGNPHVHLDPKKLLQIAEKLSTRLQKIDFANASDYVDKFKVFESNWLAAMARWESKVGALKGKPVFVHHTSFSYFVDWLGLKVVGDLEPKPGLPPTTGHLSRLIRTAEQEKPIATLVGVYRSEKSAKWLEGKTGVKSLHLAYTVGGAKDANSLIALYDSMLTKLLNEL